VGGSVYLNPKRNHRGLPRSSITDAVNRQHELRRRRIIERDHVALPYRRNRVLRMADDALRLFSRSRGVSGPAFRHVAFAEVGAIVTRRTGAHGQACFPAVPLGARVAALAEGNFSGILNIAVVVHAVAVTNNLVGLPTEDAR